MKRTAKWGGLIGFALVLGLGVQWALAGEPPPDLSGIWSPGFLQSIAKNPPMLPNAKKIFEQRVKHPETDPLAFCLPPGLPRLMDLAFPIEFVQTAKEVYIMPEYGNFVRRVYIGGTLPKDPDPIWHGYSVGHYEGRTLVVNTIGFNDRTWLDMLGHPHSDALRITERYTLSKDGNTLEQQVTIDDPKMYSHPWQSVPTYHHRLVGTKIQEYICIPSAVGEK